MKTYDKFSYCIIGMMAVAVIILTAVLIANDLIEYNKYKMGMCTMIINQTTVAIAPYISECYCHECKGVRCDNISMGNISTCCRSGCIINDIFVDETCPIYYDYFIKGRIFYRNQQSRVFIIYVDCRIDADDCVSGSRVQCWTSNSDILFNSPSKLSTSTIVAISLLIPFFVIFSAVVIFVNRRGSNQ